MLSKFLGDDNGAVTIDWVALTAGILLLGIAVVYGIFEGGVSSLATSINSNLSGAVAVPDGIDDPPGKGDFSSTGTGTGGTTN